MHDPVQLISKTDWMDFIIIYIFYFLLIEAWLDNILSQITPRLRADSITFLSVKLSVGQAGGIFFIKKWIDHR